MPVMRSKAKKCTFQMSLTVQMGHLVVDTQLLRHPIRVFNTYFTIYYYFGIFKNDSKSL